MTNPHPTQHGKKLRMHRRSQPGAAPGTVLADPHAPKPVVRVLSYNAQNVEEKEITDLADLVVSPPEGRVIWIDVEGLGDAETINRLGQRFGLHPLALEDVVNTHQRAKVENYGDYLFIVARMPIPGEHLDTRQISIFLGKGFVLTFQERAEDCLEPVRKRIKSGGTHLRQSGADCLAYALLDAAVDAYFPALEQYGEWLDELDDEITARPLPRSVSRIRDLRNELLLLRRAVWPLRDALAALLREPSPLITDETRVFLRDCYDHTVQIIDLAETYRELCSDLRDYYLSTISNHTNEIMKVLTIIATIFIPLSFVAGVYGMNFDTEVSPWNMPELHWVLGYPFALGLMVAMAIGLLWYLRHRGWLG